MKTKIVSEGQEDLTVTIRRIGRLVLVTSERPGIAKSLERSIIKALQGNPAAPDRVHVIGFGTDAPEGEDCEKA